MAPISIINWDSSLTKISQLFADFLLNKLIKNNVKKLVKNS